MLLAALTLSVATFPGEPHVNLVTGQSLSAVQCGRWFSEKFDRLHLPRVDVVDDEKLAKIVEATSSRKLSAYAGERTRNFRNRDFNCSDLSYADLRRVDLTDARLSGAGLYGAALEGASLDYAYLQGASLKYAHLQDASLRQAQLQGASLDGTYLQGAVLNWARLQGASLDIAQLQGASIVDARLQSASLMFADLQGANLNFTWLQGSSLDATNLQGASLDGAYLQGASLQQAQLQGASLLGAQLQGANLDRSSMTYAYLSGAYLWRTNSATCWDARVYRHKPDPIIEFRVFPGPDKISSIQATPEEIEKFIERLVTDIPDTRVGNFPSYPTTHIKDWTRQQMRAGLIADPTNDNTADLAKVWSDCEELAKKITKQEFDSELASFLRNLVCDARDSLKAIASGIIHNWIEFSNQDRIFKALLARGLLGEDGKACAATKDFDDRIKEKLRKAIAAAANSPATNAPVPLAAQAQ